MLPLAGIHAVREALRAGKAIDRVHVIRGAAGPRLQEIIDLCRERRIPLRFEARASLDRLVKGLSHQGVVAYPAAEKYASLEDVLPGAEMLVALDGVEDPHNLGAVIRSAHAAGVTAVVIPERRAAPLTESVARASAGALSLIPVVRVGNLNRALEQLKEKGFWVYGLDERGPEIYSEVQYAKPAAIVLGAEGRGLHEQVRKHCDFLVRIPMAGKIASLNVSVAAGIVLFDWLRRKPQQAGKA